MDGEGSAGTSVPGDMGPLKSAIRGLTEAAVNALYHPKKQTHTPLIGKESVKSSKGPTDNLLGKVSSLLCYDHLTSLNPPAQTLDKVVVEPVAENVADIVSGT
ncbi:hypothetical protein C0992_008338, partial [Termitomyces sp. T32_za158]